MSVQDQYDEKYRSLIDDQIWKFIEITESWYPPTTAALSVEEQRENYNALCEAFYQGTPDGVVSRDMPIRLQVPDQGEPDQINTRMYRMDGQKKPTSLVLYLHGGGFVVGGLESHDDICAEICKQTEAVVVAVDFALAPEFTFPTDHRQCMAVLESLAKVKKRIGGEVPIIVVGDSAGGNLAAALCHATRGQEHAPQGQVLIYPGLASQFTGGSYEEHANAPMLTTQELHGYKSLRTGSVDSLAERADCSPLNDTTFAGLPPTVVFSAQCDPLCGDGELYCARIVDEGGRAHCTVEEGLVHGYLRARHMSDRAADSFARITEAISMLAEGEWEFDET